MKKYYPFVNEPINENELKETKPYNALKLLEDKGGYSKLTKNEKEFVNTHFSELWNIDTYKTGRYKIMGWILDFSKYLKTYLVKTKYYGWNEIKAFNKTCIRKNAVVPSHVLEIIEK